MSSTPHKQYWWVNGGTTYHATDQTQWCIPNNATNITLHVECYNSNGSRIQVGSLRIVNYDCSGHEDWSYTLYNVIGGYATSATGNNGSAVKTVGWQIGQDIAYVDVWVDYTGSAYWVSKVKHTSDGTTWSGGLPVKKGDTGAQVSAYHTPDGSTWNKIA